MGKPRGTFAAIATNTHHSPALAEMRRIATPLSDVYYYRAVIFCKEFSPSGQLLGRWGSLASFVNWPDSPDELRQFFVAAGAVEGTLDELWDWDRHNGYLIRAAAEKAAKVAARRRAGKRSAKKRRAKQLSLLRAAQAPRKQRRLPFPRGGRGANKSSSKKETPER